MSAVGEREHATAGDVRPGAPSRIAGPTTTDDRGAVVVVWSVLVALTGWLLYEVFHATSNVPLAEDWNLVRPLFGDQPSFWGWVWAQNQEHRSPIHRLIYLGLLHVWHDFRVGMVFDILLMAVVAGALVVAARRIRGRTSLVDAFLPIMLLHLGNWENLLWSWQMQFVLVTATVLVVLAWLATVRRPIRARSTIAVGVALVLLPLGGGTALPMVPLLLVAFVATVWTRGSDAWGRVVAIATTTGAVLVTAAYFVGWHRPVGEPANPGPKGTARTTMKALALAWGPVNRSGSRYRLVAFALVVVVVIAAAALLVVVWRRHAAPRRRTLALAAYLLATLVTVLALGWGRAGQARTQGLADRYAYVAVPVLTAAFFVWLRFGRGVSSRVVLIGMVAASVAFLPLNVHAGQQWRKYYRTGVAAVVHDIDTCVPRAELVRRNQPFLLHWDRALLAHDIELLRRHGIGPFARLPAPGASCQPRH